MSESQSTTDLDAQIEKLEEKLNELLDRVQKSQVTPQETAPETTSNTQEYIPPQPEQTTSETSKSRQEILAEYEKGYLSRLAENERAQEEIKRAAAELKAKKQAEQSSTHTSSTRGSLPKGF